MTAPVSGFHLTIRDDGTAVLSAADAERDGQAWAIPARPVPLSTARQVALALGPDAYAGLEARLAQIEERLAAQAATAAERVVLAAQAAQRLADFRAEVGRE